jgi:hypothetical protein
MLIFFNIKVSHYILPEMWGILREDGGGWQEMSEAKH